MSRPRAQSRETSALRPLWLQVYLPNLMIATGQGAMLPVLALAAQHVHASVSVASVIVAVNGFGTMLFDIPSGWIVARFGELRSSRAAGLFLAIGLLGAIEAKTTLLLGVSVFIAACGWAIWSLVRLTHLSRVAPLAIRGRALSVFGGVTRAGNVVGPFVLIAVAGSKNPHDAFLVYLVAVLVGFGWLALARDRRDHQAMARRLESIRPLEVVTQNKREFATAGVGTFGISVLRASRQAVIPLWGAHIGLDAGQISTIFGLSSIVDLSLFYPAGIVSDRFGRKMVAIPCIVILSVGHVLLPFSHAYSSLFLVALLLGFGNGLGSGIVMTLGADRAPDVGRASFLAMWRLVSDAGTTAGPLIDAAAIAVLSLSLAGPIVGVVGFGSAYVVARYMRETTGFVLPMQEREPGGG